MPSWTIRGWWMRFSPARDIFAISSEFYFYVLARHVLKRAGIHDRKLCDYVGSLLETFSRANGMRAPHVAGDCGRQYISDMLIALTHATHEQSFLLRAHVGNYSLFLSGIFHENTHRRSLRGAPDLEFYEKSDGPITRSWPHIPPRAVAN